MLEVIEAGVLTTIQDRGRKGLRHLGIPWSGVLIPAWQQIANHLVNNPADQSVLECFEGGFTAVFNYPARLAIAADLSLQAELLGGTVSAGDADATHHDTVKVQAWRSYSVTEGMRIRVRSTGQWRLAVIAIAGLDLPQHLGSTATYAKAGLGGLDGQSLRAGDLLPISQQSASLRNADASANIDTSASANTDINTNADGGAGTVGVNLESPDRQIRPHTITACETGVLRAVPGPQDTHFSKASLHNFFNAEFQLSNEVDRMGARLLGPALEHRDASCRDIISDAIVPGSVQVPGNGLPIVLLADAHTAGGYPKIATVISTDLPALALWRAGTPIRFESVSTDEAIDISRNTAEELAQHLRSVTSVSDYSLNMQALYHSNLIDGVVDARDSGEQACD